MALTFKKEILKDVRIIKCHFVYKYSNPYLTSNSVPSLAVHLRIGGGAETKYVKMIFIFQYGTVYGILPRYNKEMN